MKSRKEVAQEWQKRGFSCGLWTDDAGQKWENFTHEADELVMVIEGDVEFEFDSCVYHPQVGEELLIPAKSCHSVRNIGKTTAYWLFGYKI
ncbi:MAG: cupin domain-containing protein [SAR324 cluster bacterium]|nr:cupin domain-containing protein [SAR324 cluster bacterium]